MLITDLRRLAENPSHISSNLVDIHKLSSYSYLKKLIEEANAQEDTKKLLQFCSWENPTFSHAVLHELLWQIAIAYTHELRPYLDLLFHILMMQDSWQSIRIQKSLRGIPGAESTDQSSKQTKISLYFLSVNPPWCFQTTTAPGKACLTRFLDPRPTIKSAPTNASNCS